jgi:hypothetical protein
MRCRHFRNERKVHLLDITRQIAHGRTHSRSLRSSEIATYRAGDLDEIS